MENDEVSALENTLKLGAIIEQMDETRAGRVALSVCVLALFLHLYGGREGAIKYAREQLVKNIEEFPYHLIEELKNAETEGGLQ